MARIKKEQEVEEVNEISQAEVDSYDNFCKEHKQYKVGGVWVTSREQYLIENGWMTFKDGEFFVQDPYAVKRVDDIESKVKREKFSPPPEYWAEIREKIGIIKSRVVRAEDNEIPF